MNTHSTLHNSVDRSLDQLNTISSMSKSGMLAVHIFQGPQGFQGAPGEAGEPGPAVSFYSPYHTPAHDTQPHKHHQFAWCIIQNLIFVSDTGAH